ncbi:hypothetical protein NDU88_006839 [Pleurodeles waltl]|uniref:Uncharacterized protein n=1 Tax=Pleurodeles waltl TaxID=8319 RepID=A0AAV7WHH8_PLEWA|nr:hypothetical protein NDU88_006839 [Pleurodeles waltl]
MGKADKRQAKLSFSGGEKRGATSATRSGDADAEEGSPEMSVRAMFMELKSSLAGIDAKLDHVTERLDRIRARVDDHDARFETLETRTSEIEDARSGDREQIARLLEGEIGHDLKKGSRLVHPTESHSIYAWIECGIQIPSQNNGASCEMRKGGE